MVAAVGPGLWSVLFGIATATESHSCKTTDDCEYGELCIRGKSGSGSYGCHFVLANRDELSAPAQHGSLPDSCFGNWPNISNCVKWYINGTELICESNDVPPYYVPPYCPFGIGEGYCQSPTVGNSTDCPPFAGIKCPCHTNVDDDEAAAACPPGTTSAGDVMVPTYQLFKFPLKPDPTDPSKPKHMYDNSALTTGNNYQVIGAHINGVQLKGPAEANGFNVDTSLIPLPCGGHVTPPVGSGPVYHYHKAADCVHISTSGAHGPLIGYASDGFGIYGYDDFSGDPVLDQCHGHFGPVPSTGNIEYHYHAAAVTNMPHTPHKPYYMGCQGPSQGKCNATVNKEFDNGADWCGEGCGYDICVQPGANKTEFMDYLSSFPGGTKWLDGKTINCY